MEDRPTGDPADQGLEGKIMVDIAKLAYNRLRSSEMAYGVLIDMSLYVGQAATLRIG